MRGNPFSPSPSLRSRVNGCGNPFSFEGNTVSFVIRTRNDKRFSCCKYRGVYGKPPSCHCEGQSPAAIRLLPLSSLRSRANGCGNPFFYLRVLRILSCFALRMTDHLVFAVRVSGGHLCEAEAPIGPADKTAVKRCFFIFYGV